MPYEAGDRHYINLRDVVASVMYQLKDFLAPESVVHFEVPISSWQIVRAGSVYPLEQVALPYRSAYGRDAERNVIEFVVSKKQADKFLKEKARELFDWADIKD